MYWIMTKRAHCRFTIVVYNGFCFSMQVGSVIKNPEIASLVPTLLMALTDPNEYTKHSLDILLQVSCLFIFLRCFHFIINWLSRLLLWLQTTFINSIDAPSLALLVPIVHRGLRERSAETKKKASQIVGNMCSLVTEPKDMIPYVGLLLPEVKKVVYYICKLSLFRINSMPL